MGRRNGLTAPNGPSQQRVIRAALANAGLSAADVDVVEAHGTGTTLGDPIEAQALLASYGQDRAERTLAGVDQVEHGPHAGRRGRRRGDQDGAGDAPRDGAGHAACRRAQPARGLDGRVGAAGDRGAALAGQRSRPRRAGVSSFGISGTNAHVIVEAAPPLEASATAERGGTTVPVVPWALSAKSESALRAQAARLADHLRAHGELDIADVGWSLAGRATFEHRGVVVGGDRDRLLAGLDELAAWQCGDAT